MCCSGHISAMEDKKHKLAYLGKKETDTDRILELFNNWQQKHTTLCNEKTLLQQKVESQEGQLSLYRVNERLLQEDILNIKKIHDNFQKLLTEKCTIEEENWMLKNSVKALQEERDTLKQKMIEMDKDWTEKESQKKLEAEKALCEALSTAEEKYKQTSDQLYSRIQSKEEENKNLMQQIQNLEKAKTGEITRLRLHYDAKLLQVQQESAKAQQQLKAPVNSATSAIFRQKLMSAKQASEKEIQSLKRTVVELQHKLQASQKNVKKRRF